MKNRYFKIFNCFLVLCFAKAEAQEINALSAKTFQTDLRQTPNAQLLDLRSTEGFEAGHIKGAVSIDYVKNSFEKKAIARLNKVLPLYIYSLTGSKAKNATTFLKDLGFSEVFYLQKGFANWTASSFPYVSSKGSFKPIASFTVGNLNTIVQNNRRVFLFLSAPWCKHCKIMEPIVRRNTGEGTGIKFVKIDISRELAISEHFNATDTPTLVLFKNGKQVWRNSGEIDEANLIGILWGR